MPEQGEMITTFTREINEAISGAANEWESLRLSYGSYSKSLIFICMITIAVQKTASSSYVGCTSRDPECFWQVKSEFTKRAADVLKDNRTSGEFLQKENISFHGVICKNNEHLSSVLAGVTLHPKLSPQLFLCEHLLIMKVDLSGKNLLKTISSQLIHLANLKLLNLDQHSFSGPLPDFSAASQVLSVDLYYKNSTGTIPGSLGTLSELRTFEISSKTSFVQNPLGCLYVYSYVRPGKFYFDGNCSVQDQNLTIAKPCHTNPFTGITPWIIASLSGIIIVSVLFIICGVYLALDYSYRRPVSQVNPTVS